MSDNREPENNGGNPWVKSLLVWGGIFLALLLVVSMFGGPRAAGGTQIGYSDFRQKVAEGSQSFSVTKTGFENFIFVASRQQPLLYGLVCVVLALATGWFAGVVFRR